MTASSTLLEQFSAFQADNNVNLVSAYGAAHFAIKSFQQLPQSSLKTFIYTGNKLPFMIVQPLLSQGVGKAGAAHLIHYLAEQHKHEGYRYVYLALLLIGLVTHSPLLDSTLQTSERWMATQSTKE